ncbi:MAG: hypothetical protein WCV79_01800 [Candidatus Paceibacterota bacterium]|jgi:hypothetical protein
MKTISFLVLSVVLMAGIVSAATTISTDISTGGTLNVTGTSTFMGKVGIGTTTPTGLLNIYNPVSGQNDGVIISGNGSHYIYFSRGQNFNHGLLIGKGTSAASSGFTNASNIRSAGGVDENIEINPGRNASSASGRINIANLRGLIGIGPSVSTPIALVHISSSTPSSDLFRIDGSTGNTLIYKSSGSFGIGITAPTALLHVSTTSPGIDVFKVTAGAQNLVYNSSGNLGIGTTTPVSKLHVSNGASATTTINVGEFGSLTSKACFNTKNLAGADISYYFNGTTMVVENNPCR